MLEPHGANVRDSLLVEVGCAVHAEHFGADRGGQRPNVEYHDLPEVEAEAERTDRADEDVGFDVRLGEDA